MVNMPAFTLRADKQGRIMLPSKWKKDAGIRSSTELRAVVDESGALILETGAAPREGACQEVCG